ncbi:AlpA family transcriptional regulator [Microbacterium sp. RU33B]|uniref:helix-turn-helix transcriptional regulator n=1 Tax=Microbacterium sp. RU33B TaxID=1907390 RepID=UPI0009764131|nr:helix-turn-helix domain-containing protein [Microbacterium sp. RU33B]
MTTIAPETARPSSMPELLTQAQVADILAVSPRALEDWRVTGDGPPYLKLSHKVLRYDAAALTRWLRTRRAA